MIKNPFHRETISAKLLVCALLTFGLPELAAARAIESEISDLGTHIENVAKPDTINGAGNDAGKSEFIAAPIPLINPTVGTGLAAVGAYLFMVDAGSQSSFVGVGGGYTDNGSWAFGAAQSIYLKQDRYIIDVKLGYAVAIYDFFGVGSDAGETGSAISLEQNVWATIVGGKVRLAPSLYLGSRLWFYDIDTIVPLTQLGNLFPSLDPTEFGMHNMGISLLGDFDTRDNRFNTTSGTLASVAVHYGVSDIGDRFNFKYDYQKVEINITRYMALPDESTLALRASGCGVWGQPPLFDLCLFGAKSDLRGYVIGQYRDRAMFATQAEYRRDLFWKIGMVAFVGVGGVAEDMSAFSWDQLLPSVGAGIRVNLSEEFGVNFGMDYAHGRDSDAIYFRIGEAF